MLIDAGALTRIFGVQPRGILHVGAHQAEELVLYRTAGWLERGPVIWVEAQATRARELERRLAGTNAKVIEAVAWDVDGAALELKIASNSQSTSVFEFGSHAASYPDITWTDRCVVTGRRLDSLLSEADQFDFVALDVQGAELAALRGLGDRLGAVRWVYTECQQSEVYAGAPDVSALDAFLGDRGFVRVATRWAGRHGWGDALYCRTAEIEAMRRPARVRQRCRFAAYRLLLFIRERRGAITDGLRRAARRVRP